MGEELGKLFLCTEMPARREEQAVVSAELWARAPGTTTHSTLSDLRGGWEWQGQGRE